MPKITCILILLGSNVEIGEKGQVFCKWIMRIHFNVSKDLIGWM